MGAYHTMQDTTRCTEGNMVHNTFINVYDMGEGCAVNNLSAVSDIYLLLASSHSPYQESQHHNTCHFSQVSNCNSSPWILHMKYDMIRLWLWVEPN